MLTILFDGVAYGMLLFVLACGLAVTLGLMNFVNLAHGAFAMAGGYVTAVLMNGYGIPFLLTLPLAFLVPAGIGLVLERTLYVRLYNRPHLDQVLFSIGLVFMAIAAVDFAMGSQQQIVRLPTVTRRRHRVAESDQDGLEQAQHERIVVRHEDAERLLAGGGGRCARFC